MLIVPTAVHGAQLANTNTKSGEGIYRHLINTIGVLIYGCWMGILFCAICNAIAIYVSLKKHSYSQHDMDACAFM